MYPPRNHREDLSADERLRVVALKAAVDTQETTDGSADVENRARLFYDFLTDS